MITQPKSKRFNQHILTKYQIYNSIFITLPFDNISNTGVLMPLLNQLCQDGFKNGETPVEIIDSFFNKYLENPTEKEKIDLIITIEDTGIGIAKDKFETIFDSFNQVDYNTKRKYGGTGLGLSIVKQIIEAYNSEISIKSELNKGTEFYFDIVFEKQYT